MIEVFSDDETGFQDRDSGKALRRGGSGSLLAPANEGRGMLPIIVDSALYRLRYSSSE
jgi:hypothetical protein